MKKIYLVRHGATDNNLANMMQDENTPLSELGLQQALFVANRFKSIKVDRVLASSMKRASQTAEAIGKEKKLEVEHTDLLIEILKPSAVRNKSKDDPEVKEILKHYKANFGVPDAKHSNEENFFDLKDRSKRLIEYVQSLPEENLALVTHGQFLTFFVGYLMFGEDFSAREFKRMEHFFIAKNTGISIIEMGDDANLLITWNDHAHLGDLDIY